MNDPVARSDIKSAWNSLNIDDMTVAVIEDQQMQVALGRVLEALATATYVKQIARQRQVIAKAERMKADAEAKMQELASGHTPTD